jgi:hypothetical protein
MLDSGTILWFLAVVGGTALLGIGFAYAVAQWQHRDRRLDPIREEATKQNYAADEAEADLTEPPAAPTVTHRPAPNVTRRSSAA